MVPGFCSDGRFPADGISNTASLRTLVRRVSLEALIPRPFNVPEDPCPVRAFRLGSGSARARGIHWRKKFGGCHSGTLMQPMQASSSLLPSFDALLVITDDRSSSGWL